MSFEQSALSDIQMDALAALAEQYDGKVRSYSGRGMYGQTCLGVSIDGHLIGFAMRLGAQLALTADALTAETLAGQVGVDSMGRGSIVYFPRIAAPADIDDEDDSEDDEDDE